MEKRGLIWSILMWIIIAGILFTAGYLLLKDSFFATGENENEEDVIIVKNATIEKQCTVNEDCVPASCCHPSSCVNKENAKDCSKAICSQVCEPGTLDCGQGNCECVSNKCEAVMK